MASDDDASTIRFLVTTDNHLGYMERDPRRGDDSFVTFEECLSIGRVQYDCDAVLLGGDFFHDNKPSLNCMTRTMALLKKFVLGSKSISLQLMSDAAFNFPTHPFPLANFNDPNINVALPVFMIHGNHDDPVSGVSPIDVLAHAGLVNYFGHTTDVDDIVIRPVLLKKGNTYVALYGLGNVRDERLHRCFTLGKVRFVKPRTNGERWYSILLIHQNRGCRSTKGGGITEEMLTGFSFDLVIWGNEHEQRMTPLPVDTTLEVIQPGSTILTSLGAAESNPKQCGILEVCGTAYRLTPHTLQSVRPVVRRTVVLWRQPNLTKMIDDVENYLKKEVSEMLIEADERIRRIPDHVLRTHPQIRFPLLRLAVDFTDPQGGVGFPQPNLNRFGQQFLDVVVNPNDLLKPIKPTQSSRGAVRGSDPNARDLDGILAPAAHRSTVPEDHGTVTTDDIRTKIAQVFSANAKDACMLLSEPVVSHAVYSFVEKSERDAIRETISELLQGCQRSVWKEVRDHTESLTPVRIAELVVLHKQEQNRTFFEKIDGDGGPDAEQQGPIRTLSSKSLGVIPLGAPFPPTGGLAAAGAANNNAGSPAVNDNGGSGAAQEAAAEDVIVVDDDALPVSAAGPPVSETKRRRQAPRSSPGPKKPRQPPPAVPPPQLTTTAANPTAAVLAKWMGAT